MLRSLFCLVVLCSTTVLAAADLSTEVLIYGGTPGGIAAALAAARDGRKVVLVEQTPRIGGLTTSGLSHTDFHSFESLTGSFLDFANRVQQHYVEAYGANSQQVHDCFRGTFAEPKVNLLVFQSMLAEHDNITLKTGWTLAFLSGSKNQDRKRIDSVSFQLSDGQTMRVQAAMFIDATYEGDLMAMAGIRFRVGREGREEYGESLAPEKGDHQLQAYNFRLIMTRDPANRVVPSAPEGYRREDFTEVLPLLASQKLKTIFGYPRGCIFKAQTPPLPNGKYDINDVSTGLVRLSLPGKNTEWPEGNATVRARIFKEHLRDQTGLLYFLQNDKTVPEPFRKEAAEWGWCQDEFVETGHLPPQLYVREARRMKGLRIFTQQDSEYTPGDARAILHRDSIAMGDYGNNCHGTGHEGPRFGGHHSGEFYNPVPPYQIPYGTLVPREFENVLVPVAASSSHVGFCALRLEPIWMSLGQAAGHAASQAIVDRIPVQQVNVQQLQQRLHSVGSATIYVSDVLPGHPDFIAVQWWGTRGGLHGLASTPAKPGGRGKRIASQYTEAALGHSAELNQPLDESLRSRWQKIFPMENPEQIKTRGDWIRTAWRLHQSKPAP